MRGKVKMKDIIVVLGHYGSGKTEFAINYAIKRNNEISIEQRSKRKVALLDFDIANPYFRSRERQDILEKMGITTIFNEYGYDISEDLPAITAKVRYPLEDERFETIVDVGGNDSGARIINQFKKYFIEDKIKRYFIINANRFETDTVEGAMRHIAEVETEIGLKINGIVNNTHLLTETSINDIIKGHEISMAVSRKLNVPLIYDVCQNKMVEELKNSVDDTYNIFSIELQMRPTWLDQKL